MSLKCDNCTNPALYQTGGVVVNPAYYCFDCIPFWLQDEAKNGFLPIVTEDAPADTKKKKKTSDTAEAPADVISVEEPVADASN